MSAATDNILKLLSDLSAASDNIVEENASELSRVSEWATIVKNKADSIAERGSSSSESGEIPSLTSFVKGRSLRGPRVSTVLTDFLKSHLHRKGKASIKARKSRKSSIKTPLRQKSNAIGSNKTIIIDSGSDTKKSTPKINDKARFVLNQNHSSSTSSVEIIEDSVGSFKTPAYGKGATSSVEIIEKVSLSSFKTPVHGKGTTSKMGRSSKRKSSSKLSLEVVKKPKLNKDQLSDPKKRDKSMQNAKVEKLTKAKNSSKLPNSGGANIKTSVDANVSVLKENRTLRSKMETKQEKAVENRKNIMALRHQKLEQNKRTREEKLEKTIQQRMILEKEKLSKLRSGGGREKTLKTSNKGVTPKSNVENETLVGTSNSGKNKEKQTSLKKTQKNLKKAGTSILKSNEKTPAMKNPKHETEKLMNTTYVAEGQQPSTSGKKEKTQKDPNIGGNSEKTKDVSNDNKTQTLTHAKEIKNVPKTMKSLNEQKKQLISTPVQKKGPESYAITPARSSFVSYDISEIRSDSEDEEQAANSKPIPSWAIGMRLRNTLLQQHHNPIDTDELFGNYFDPPDLTAIMGIQKKHYNKRTSSAIWNSSFV